MAAGKTIFGLPLAMLVYALLVTGNALVSTHVSILMRDLGAALLK